MTKEHVVREHSPSMSPGAPVLSGCFLLPGQGPVTPSVVGELLLIPLHRAVVQRGGCHMKRRVWTELCGHQPVPGQ